MKSPATKFRRYWLPLGWPTAVILFVTGMLWTMWPRGRYAPRPRRRLPEPGAAYVRMEGASGPLYQRPMLFALPSRIGFGARAHGMLPDSLPGAPENFVPRVLPLECLDVPGPAVGEGGERPEPAEWFRGAPWPEAAEAAMAPHGETGGVRVVCSPGLRRAGFQVASPDLDLSLTNTFWRLTFYLEPLENADPGMRLFLKTEGAPPPRARRAWRAAMLAAAAAHPEAHGIARVETVVQAISGVDKQDRFGP